MKAHSKYLMFSTCILASLVSNSVHAECSLTSLRDGSDMNIESSFLDSEEAVTFLQTCENPYTEKYQQDQNLYEQGTQIYQNSACVQCHGSTGKGQTAPSLVDGQWLYPELKTDKGLFEIIAGGSNGGMSKWHAQTSNNPQMMSTDEILKIIAWIRKQE